MLISERYTTDREILEEQDYSYKWGRQEMGGISIPTLILTTPPIPGDPIVTGRKYGSYHYYKMEDKHFG